MWQHLLSVVASEIPISLAAPVFESKLSVKTMQNNVIYYLHGFNSASLDLNEQLLVRKTKLLVLREFCNTQQILLHTPNVDYRDFKRLVDDGLALWRRYQDSGYQVTFMGSSMGGFASEYLAMKTGCKAIMINPAINPSVLLSQFIGVEANYETGQPYEWFQSHCDQYAAYEQELVNSSTTISRTLLLDLGDELLDAEATRVRYESIAKVVAYEGGSHGFDHLREALPILQSVLSG